MNGRLNWASVRLCGFHLRSFVVQTRSYTSRLVTRTVIFSISSGRTPSSLAAAAEASIGPCVYLQQG